MTFDNPRLGFCCKFIPDDGDAGMARRMNVAGLTMAYLGRLSPGAAFDKLATVVSHNLDAVAAQIEWVAGRPPLERLLRLASNILPGYTHPDVRGYYADPDLRQRIESGFERSGELARQAGIRISLHPGPFCILATTSGTALANAVDELEYHAEVLGMMGYGGGWHPHGAHINIHVGARGAGLDGFRAGLTRVSGAVRNLLGVENDETSYGFDEVLQLADEVPTVLDLHHHWIASGGEYIEPTDPRVGRTIESWRGVRPVCHISVSREDVLPGHTPETRPDFPALIRSGLKPRDLMGHSDMMWNAAVNALVARHLAWADFEIEAKWKNLATVAMADEIGPGLLGVAGEESLGGVQAASFAARRSVRASRASR